VDTKRRNPDLGGMTEMAEREEAEGDLSGGGDFLLILTLSMETTSTTRGQDGQR
jgi:hypothetical protein